jgi:hypothetical protein
MRHTNAMLRRLAHLPWHRLLPALAVQAAVFWGVLALLGQGAVATPAWCVLHAVLAAVLCGCVLWPWRWASARQLARIGPRRWLWIAFYALFLALFFAAADIGLDALHGVQRKRPEIAAQLGGLALWQLLCPGVFSVAVAALLDALRAVTSRTRNTPHPCPPP